MGHGEVPLDTNLLPDIYRENQDVPLETLYSMK